jgi:hypothetical protein
MSALLASATAAAAGESKQRKGPPRPHTAPVPMHHPLPLGALRRTTRRSWRTCQGSPLPMRRRPSCTAAQGTARLTPSGPYWTSGPGIGQPPPPSRGGGGGWQRIWLEPRSVGSSTQGGLIATLLGDGSGTMPPHSCRRHGQLGRAGRGRVSSLLGQI